MAITRDSRHKRRNTGGRRNVHKKKRKYETGRQAAMTKLITTQGQERRVSEVRTRGGNKKFRALRLDTGNYSWGTENCSKAARILDVVYNASNNELTRTKTLVKNCIVEVDATPFREWYQNHYGVRPGKKRSGDDEAAAKSRSVQQKQAKRCVGRTLEQGLADQFSSGRLLACVSSRPGQCGRADGYILEGAELDFYKRIMNKKKGKK